jgi:hypothetical protein
MLPSFLHGCYSLNQYLRKSVKTLVNLLPVSQDYCGFQFMDGGGVVGQKYRFAIAIDHSMVLPFINSFISPFYSA